MIVNLYTVYGNNDKYIKTKIKSYGDKVNTSFQGIKPPEENASCKCLSLIMLDYVIRVNRKYYPQTLSEECKYEIKNNKMENSIDDDFDTSSFDKSDSESNSKPNSDPDSESDNGSEKPFKKSSKKPSKKTKSD